MAAVKGDGCWVCYDIAPMDIGWDRFELLADACMRIAKEQCESCIAFGFAGIEQTDQLMKSWLVARDLAKQCGWDGDFAFGPVVFYLPDVCAAKYAFAWKQGNNGNTFVVSPVELSWLEDKA